MRHDQIHTGRGGGGVSNIVTFPRPRFYSGHIDPLYFAPHADELSDEAARRRWWDVYQFGYADGRVMGIKEERACWERRAKAEFEAMETERQQIAKSKDVSFDRLCELRGEPGRAQAIRAYWQTIDIDRSPYAEMKERGLVA